MALDVGGKRIGVAVTDEMGWTAQGLETIHRKDLEADIARISELVEEYKVERLIVGLPLRGEGEVGIQAEKVLKFADKVKEALPEIALETFDESMTTHEAHEVLAAGGVTSKKRKKVVDKLAAVFILESYMHYKGIL